ncbi:hypothetical protein CB1_000678032 [Camelus ferus]|nr:hypothetical protein CB1_000678032 [Camelus ferus]
MTVEYLSAQESPLLQVLEMADDQSSVVEQGAGDSASNDLVDAKPDRSSFVPSLFGKAVWTRDEKNSHFQKILYLGEDPQLKKFLIWIFASFLS